MLGQQSTNTPIVIAGPCMAESLPILKEALEFLLKLSDKLQFNLVFKASFDKANRTSIHSYRGPGLNETMAWFAELKTEYNCNIITDVHETHEVEKIKDYCDAIQIPAFLCRQTDLVTEAAKTGKWINIKKGQFMAPSAMKHIVDKAEMTCKQNKLPPKISLTERGACFGYGDLIVDMRSLAIMAESKAPIFFDITHSTQKPPHGDGRGTSGALRKYAPLLARSAAASGYVSGFFLETHPNPQMAKSDADAQLNFEQAEKILTQILPLMKECNEYAQVDNYFID
ncbi:MAG: 3-deoxy-8-phosphooctulonate synthase [Bdellovibrionota bacterium]